MNGVQTVIYHAIVTWVQTIDIMATRRAGVGGPHFRVIGQWAELCISVTKYRWPEKQSHDPHRMYTMLLKTSLDRSWTDCISQPITLTLTYDLDLQSSASDGHDLLTCKSSRLTVSRRFRR